MPCGGIEPMENSIGTVQDKLDPTQGGCWMCGRGGCKHFCHEWDTYIHAICALDFLLNTDEGRCVTQHRHQVVLDFDLEDKDLPIQIALDVVGKLSPDEAQQVLDILERNLKGGS